MTISLETNGVNHWFDYSLYPEEELPQLPTSVTEKADFLARLCAAWDFGILPYPETVAEIRQAHWREAVAECQLLTSIAYHILREWHQLPELPYWGPTFAHIENDPCLHFV